MEMTFNVAGVENGLNAHFHSTRTGVLEQVGWPVPQGSLVGDR
jgi:hypothetical protein